MVRVRRWSRFLVITFPNPRPDTTSFSFQAVQFYLSIPILIPSSMNSYRGIVGRLPTTQHQVTMLQRGRSFHSNQVICRWPESCSFVFHHVETKLSECHMCSNLEANTRVMTRE